MARNTTSSGSIPIPNSGRIRFKPREISDRLNNDEDGVAGFLYRDPDRLWPDDPDEQTSRLPEDWFETDSSQPRLRPTLREEIPQRMPISPDGYIDPSGLDFFFTPAPFRFCQNCGVSYRARQGDSDFGRLATLSSGGRSTATTILSLSIVRMLKKDATLQEYAKKLLSFTDNRQDASLQAGHFNDFVEVSLLRSALYKAALAARSRGNLVTTNWPSAFSRPSTFPSSFTPASPASSSPRRSTPIRRCGM